MTADKAEINHRISNVKPGSGYFVYAWVDANEKDEVDDGDLLGYCGATTGPSPGRGGLDLPMPAPRGAAGDVDVDIQAAPVARVLSGPPSMTRLAPDAVRARVTALRGT